MTLPSQSWSPRTHSDEAWSWSWLRFWVRLRNRRSVRPRGMNTQKRCADGEQDVRVVDAVLDVFRWVKSVKMIWRSDIDNPIAILKSDKSVRDTSRDVCNLKLSLFDWWDEVQKQIFENILLSHNDLTVSDRPEPRFCSKNCITQDVFHKDRRAEYDD